MYLIFINLCGKKVEEKSIKMNNEYSVWIKTDSNPINFL